MNDVQEHQSQSPLMFAMAFAQKPQVPQHADTIILTHSSINTLPFTRDCPFMRDACARVQRWHSTTVEDGPITLPHHPTINAYSLFISLSTLTQHTLA